MARTRRDLANPRTIEKMFKEGRGKGEKEHYKPWLTIFDLASKGTSHRVPGWKCEGRPVHLLSNLELYFFYTKEWDSDVDDFREQYPLEPDLTEKLAQEMDIEHPRARLTKQSLEPILRKDPGARQVRPIVMTTDAYLTLKSGARKAYSVKPKSKLVGPGSDRTNEKLRLEEQYWNDCGEPWELITEESIDFTLARNVEIVHRSYFLKWFSPLSKDDADRAFEWFTPKLHDKPLSKLAADCDRELKFPPGAALRLALHLIAHKRWIIDFSKPLIPARRLNLI